MKLFSLFIKDGHAYFDRLYHEGELEKITNRLIEASKTASTVAEIEDESLRQLLIDTWNSQLHPVSRIRPEDPLSRVVSVTIPHLTTQCLEETIQLANKQGKTFHIHNLFLLTLAFGATIVAINYGSPGSELLDMFLSVLEVFLEE